MTRDSHAAGSARALAALYDSRATVRPYVTYVFLSTCILVTVPTLVIPDLYQVFGGVQPRQHWWQIFTAAFEHGWPGFPGALHLLLNTFLILECGRPCERLLGSAWFLLLGLLSLGANAVALAVTEGVNGSSIVIWAWGPPLFMAAHWARRRDASVTVTAAYARLRGVLVLMYGIIVLVMGLIPYIAGWRGNRIVGLLRGNLYHLVATSAGIVFAAARGGYIRDRLTQFAQNP